MHRFPISSEAPLGAHESAPDIPIDYIGKRYANSVREFQSGSSHYLAKARQLLAARKRLAKIMPRNLFRDSAWDVMLELYIGTAQQIDIYVKQAIIASGECPATAMRIITRLEQSGFLIRKDDESDQRRVVVSLSPAGMAAMEMLLENVVASHSGQAARGHHHPLFPLA